MALVSPGVQVSVIDQSYYAPTQLGSVAYILVATAEDKIAPGGISIAPGTLAENAGTIYNITSQRDLVTTFGTPVFQSTASGAPINGSEQNEYGLQAAYSLLGISNTVYVQRANVDLAALTGSTSRPLAEPATGALWLDTTATNWGIYEWNATTQAFALQTPIIVNSTTDLENDTNPNVGIGTIGSYAVNTVANTSPMYYKTWNNEWQLIGNIGWESNVPTITGTTSSTGNVITANSNVTINTADISLAIDSNLTTVAAAINSAGVAGVSARVNTSNQLVIQVNRLSASDGATADGRIAISNGNNTPLTDLGITAGTYAGPAVQISPYYSVPDFNSANLAANTGRPTGSIWHKVSKTGAGLDVVVKEYNATTDTWNNKNVNSYANVFAATFALDPTGGGVNVTDGSIFAQYDPFGTTEPGVLLWSREATSPMTITANTTSPLAANIGANFTLRTRANARLATVNSYTVTISTATVAGFVDAVSAASIPDVSANISSTGAMTITHASGGDIELVDGAGTPLANIGIADEGSTNLYFLYSNVGAITSTMVGTNWRPADQLDYTVSSTQVFVAPDNNTYWYYNTPSRVDVMVHNGSAWVGYRTLSSDIRGYDLTTTNSTGPIVSAVEPSTQTDGTALVYGDLWVDTSDLENYPVLYRWQSVSGINQWVEIDNTDNTGTNGILFADARWDTDGTTNPVTGAIPTIQALSISSYVDLDAPDPALYPRGMLLWNTRASGYNVKQYKSNYFTAAAYPGESLPTVANTWLTASGFDSAGIVPNFGRKAQRGVVVAALKSAIDSSTALREDSNSFNLIACPGYPELIPNMVNLNEDKENVAFVVGDTPMRLEATGTAIQAWADNLNGAGATGEEGLNTSSPYVGLYYPSALTNDLTGAAVVVPPSHVALRAIVKSDNISYPWLAPAGTRRGLIDNATAIGYVDSNSGEFVSIGVSQGIRDVLYENQINPFTSLPGTGLVVYGQKTIATEPSALDRINVARLINYLRNQLNTIARPFVFEPNDPITRNALLATVNGLLNDLIAKRGITDYLSVCDTTNNTPERIARNELYVDVAIQPTKAVEFIYIPIRLKNPGEIQDGNLASVANPGTGA
jgi:hypothetical protein